MKKLESTQSLQDRVINMYSSYPVEEDTECSQCVVNILPETSVAMLASKKKAMEGNAVVNGEVLNAST